MGLVGLLFVLVVTGQLVVTTPGWSRAFTVAGWVLWAVFVAEFALRAYVARDQRRFWRRNWWQVVFLALPFLRFTRALRLPSSGSRLEFEDVPEHRGGQARSALLSMAWPDR